MIYINGKVLDETQYIDPNYRQSWIDKIGYFNQVANLDRGDNKRNYNPDVDSNVIDFKEVTLGDDEYFVMGDNRPISKDSRSIGLIPKRNIIGVATYHMNFIIPRGKIK